MLKEIRINNFRNLLDVKINPSLITLLIGTNDSGKSGILHSLLVLKQSFHQDFRPINFSYVGNLINLGSFLEVVYLHNSTNQVEIGITASFDSKITNGPVNKSIGEFSYTGLASIDNNSFSMDLSLGNLQSKVSSMDGFKTEVTLDDVEVSFSSLNQGDLGFNGQFKDEPLRPYNKFLGTDFLREYLVAIIIFRSTLEIPENPFASDLLYLNACMWIFKKIEGIIVYMTSEGKETSFSLSKGNKMFEEVVRRVRVLKDLLEEKKVPIIEPTIECSSCQYYERCFVKQRVGKEIKIEQLFGMGKTSKNNE